MTSVNLPIGATNAGTNDWSDVHGEDQAIVDVVNGGLDNSNLSGSAGITDANLASPVAGVYRDICEVTMAGAGVNQSTGTYFFGNIAAGDCALVATGGSTATYRVLGLRQFVAADYAVAGKTTKLRVRMQIVTGSTSPGSTVVTGGLYPITISSGNWTMGTVVSGTTAASSGLATNTSKSFASSDATIPSDGLFALGVAITTAALPLGHQVSLQLQVRNV